MRAPLVVRWPGHIKPGTLKTEIFAALDWLPTLVNIAGGPKGNGTQGKDPVRHLPRHQKDDARRLRSARLPGGKDRKVRARSLLLLCRLDRVRGALQELEDVFRDRARNRVGLQRPGSPAAVRSRRGKPQARSIRDVDRRSRKRRLFWAAGALAGPVTAWIYDWNILPLGQVLWLKELESYIKYPPMQPPETWNLQQVIAQVKAMANSHPSQ